MQPAVVYQQGDINCTSSSRQHCGLDIFDENNRGAQNLKMVQVAKEIWEHLLKWRIKITGRSSKADVNNPNLDNISLVSKDY